MKLAYYGVAKPLAYLFFWRIGAVAEGVENIPRSGPIILAGNHQREGDGVLTLRSIPRRIRTIVKSDNESPQALYLLRVLADMIILDRNSSDYDALREARRVLKGGGAICMYPPGHRSTEVIGFHPGVVGLARSTNGVRIVPFGILNADHLSVKEVIRESLRGNRALKEPTIRFGEPFQLTPMRPSEARKQRGADLELIRGRVLDLLPDGMEGENKLHVI